VSVRVAVAVGLVVAMGCSDDPCPDGTVRVADGCKTMTDASSSLERGVAWGDIRPVALGKPDKTRPALVLTRSSAIDYLNALTVAPITRAIRGVPSEIVLDVEHGMKERCVANLHAVQTVSKDRMGRYLGSVGHDRKRDIREALLFSLELDL